MKEMKNKAEIVKDLLLNDGYKYVNEMKQMLPIDEDGNVLTEFLSYITLNSLHNLLASVSRDIATVIIGPHEEEDKEVEAYVESSFYIITEGTMDTIINVLNEKEEVKEVTNDEDFNIEA